jgi:Anti-sigma-K factor rskA
VNFDVHVLAGAYACDALDRLESVAFEAHLAQCETCTLEVAELRATAAALAVIAIEPPPLGLQDRVLNQILLTGQIVELPPSAVHRFGHRRQRHPVGSIRPAGHARHRRSPVVALLAGLIALGSYAGYQQHQIDALGGGSTMVSQVVAAADAQVLVGAVRSGGTATVISSRSDNEVVFSASDLPALPPGKAYQLWFVDKAAIRPGPVFTPTDGSVPGGVAAQLDSARYIAMTVEPATGSAQPTSTQVLLLPLR